MNKAQSVLQQVNSVILGKEKEVAEIMLTFLANGHILLEDIPGVGKTTLALAFSRAMSLEYKRVQFTPDVMPSDLTGFSVYVKSQETFSYRPGCVFCNLLLADEINRTSPKTQSALLEVMEERKVTVEGISRRVPSPFLVIATQNPYGSAGTQPLPEAQVDRFMVALSIGYASFDNEMTMAKQTGCADRLDSIEPVMSGVELLEMQKSVHDIFIKEDVYRYIVELVTATRESPYIERGASPRATIALVKLSKAAAMLEGREYVTPNDVLRQYPYVITHRIFPSLAAKTEGLCKGEIIAKIAETVKKPSMASA